jgi:hypothetical protein
MTNNLNFGQALEAMERGQFVKRSSWGGYWFINRDSSEIDQPMIVAVLAGTRDRVPAQPYQNDLLAKDWVIIK